MYPGDVASVPLILRIVAAIVLVAAAFLWFYARHKLARRLGFGPPKPVGFLSVTEQSAILASEHVVRVFPGSRAPTVAVETKYKYPTGASIIIEADVIDGKLTLVEPEGHRAIDLRLTRYERHPEREKSGIYPRGSEAVFEQSGCFVGSSGRIQYGPVVFTPAALVEGVYYMARTCADIYALPA